MNELIPIFSFEGNEVIVLTDNKGIEWFCAKHVCTCLGLENASKALEAISEKQKIKLEDINISDDITSSYTAKNIIQKHSNFITESGLYRLITKSRKPETQKFANWIFDEVIPTLRKKGVIAIDPQQQLLLDYKDHPEIQLALIKIELKNKEMALKDKELAELAQKQLIAQLGIASIEQMEGMTALKACNLYFTTNAGRHGELYNKGIISKGRMQYIVWTEMSYEEIREYKPHGNFGELIESIQDRLIEEELCNAESVPSYQTILKEINSRLEGKNPPEKVMNYNILQMP